ncbi:hypothetical protein [Streptomyces sp. CB03234]|uniref:hypothetical protein n=1 Tax=Streptomyces sp. (strain CB03234) TaxID=1703937 RepID=UPI00130103A1|nr:hypothetical protein [Streptomyces sp. CB03234]
MRPTPLAARTEQTTQTGRLTAARPGRDTRSPAPRGSAAVRAVPRRGLNAPRRRSF